MCFGLTVPITNPIEKLIEVKSGQSLLGVLQSTFPDVHVGDYSTSDEQRFWIGNTSNPCSSDGSYVHLHREGENTYQIHAE